MPSVAEAFSKFKKKISEPTQREQNDASKRQREIRDVIAREFDVERDFLSGSYARWTKTKPLKDVDIFCVLGEEEKHYHKEPPSNLLNAVERVLRDEYGSGRVTQQARSVSVSFPSDEEETVMSFDLVTGFDVGKHYEVPDTKSSNGWTKTDPEMHKELAAKKHSSYSDEWKGLVRMVKTWNRHHDKPVKPSFLLEVMALQLFDGSFGGDYRYELKAFFSSAAVRVLDQWPDPAGVGPDVNGRMSEGEKRSAQRALFDAEAKAAEAIQTEKAGSENAALKIWQSIFGPQFVLS